MTVLAAPSVDFFVFEKVKLLIRLHLTLNRVVATTLAFACGILVLLENLNLVGKLLLHYLGGFNIFCLFINFQDPAA